MNNIGGYALVPAVLILSVLIIIVFTMTSLLADELNFVEFDRDETKTFYTAESGIDYANTMLDDDNKWDSDNKLISGEINVINSLNNNVELISIDRSDVSGIITLVSQAEHDNGNKSKITVKYQKDPEFSELFNYSLVANGDIDVKNKVNIVGFLNDDDDKDRDNIPDNVDKDIDLDGDGIQYEEDDDIDIDGDGIPYHEDYFIDVDGDGISDYNGLPDYYGDVYTTGFVTDKSKTEFIESTYHDNQEDDIIPDIYAQVYSQLLDSEDVDGDGDYDELLDNITTDSGDTINIYENTFPTGDSANDYPFSDDIVYLDSSITFNNSEVINGSGILIVDGDITFNNGVEISNQIDENLLIISNGTVTFKNSSQFNGMVYATNEIYIKAKVDIVGSVISKANIEETTISLNNGGNDPSKIVYDRSYLELFNTLNITPPKMPTEIGYSLTVVSWKEE